MKQKRRSQAKAESAPLSAHLAFGMVIRERRLQLRLLQDEVAVKSNVDISHISRLERGLRTPTLQVIIGIAGALDITADQLMREVLDRMKPQ
jgi:XRE family transcriptional regulator, regulator of sulfur utilization